MTSYPKHASDCHCAPCLLQRKDAQIQELCEALTEAADRLGALASLYEEDHGSGTPESMLEEATAVSAPYHEIVARHYGGKPVLTKLFLVSVHAWGICQHVVRARDMSEAVQFVFPDTKPTKPPDVLELRKGDGILWTYEDSPDTPYTRD